jgi:hypothetical protein
MLNIVVSGKRICVLKREIRPVEFRSAVIRNPDRTMIFVQLPVSRCITFDLIACAAKAADR